MNRYIQYFDELNKTVSLNTGTMYSMKLPDIRLLMTELSTAEEKLSRLEELAHEKQLAEIRGK